MRYVLHAQRRGRRHFRQLIAPLMIACLLLTFGLIAAGCGGDSPTDNTATAGTTAAAGMTATSATTESTAATSTLGGSELGKIAATLWAEATQKLDALLEGLPAVEDVQDEVAALKEEYVQKLVALGKQRQSLDASAKAEADSATTAALAAAADKDWYKTYMNNYDEYAYMSGDVDFVNLLASFNILTQYADFELLKKQAPEEAARLGLE